MGNRVEYHTVVLAALLHDIGKFLQRGRSLAFDIEGPHPEVSVQFISVFADTFRRQADLELLKTLVMCHHRGHRFSGLKVEDVADPRSQLLAYLVNKADCLSSQERGQHAPQWQEFKTTPLSSVFPRIFAGQDRAPLFNHHPLPLVPPEDLSEDYFPHQFQGYDTGELENALQTFGRQAGPLLKSLGDDYQALVTHLLALLSAHTWPIPSDTQEEVPDISLYDHLRTTAAIAACLYRSYESRNAWEEATSDTESGEPFCLAVGDISGIQDYIFNIVSGVGGGVAKRLRARSLYVQLLSEAVPWLILRHFELPPTNIIMASGGKFYLLLPNLPETETGLAALQERLDKWFLDKLHGCLALNLAWVPFAEAEFKSFGDVVKRAVAGSLDERKGQRFRSALVAGGKWSEDDFLFPRFGEGLGACRSCGRFEAPRDALCWHCEQDKKWGGELRDTKHVLLFDEAAQGDRDIVGLGASLRKDLNGLPQSPSLALSVNSPATVAASPYPASFRYWVTRVPLGEDGEALDFEKIAEESAGRHYLGFLKADMDNLGEVMAYGLRGTGQRGDTISRLATLSRQLDFFFTAWVQHRLIKDSPGCYPVFSGGDDLFLVGPWDRVLEIAGQLRQDFEKWTCHNRRLTFSAGIVIAPHHYPVGQASQEAEEAVKKSKGRPEKDSLTLLGHSLFWSEWAKVKLEWDKLRGEDVSSTFLYSLLEYGAMWRDYRDNGNVLGLRFQPLLAYNVSRNVKPGSELERWAKPLIAYRPGDDQVKLILDNLGLLAQLLILGK